LSRLLSIAIVHDEDGRRLDLLLWLRRRKSEVSDVAVQVGGEHRWKARLIGIKGPRKGYRQGGKRLLSGSKGRGREGGGGGPGAGGGVGVGGGGEGDAGGAGEDGGGGGSGAAALADRAVVQGVEVRRGAGAFERQKALPCAVRGVCQADSGRGAALAGAGGRLARGEGPQLPQGGQGGAQGGDLAVRRPGGPGDAGVADPGDGPMAIRRHEELQEPQGPPRLPADRRAYHLWTYALALSV